MRKGIQAEPILIIEAFFTTLLILGLMVGIVARSGDYVKQETLGLQADKVVNAALALDATPQGSMTIPMEEYGFKYDGENIWIAFKNSEVNRSLEMFDGSYQAVEGPPDYQLMEEQLLIKKTEDEEGDETLRFVTDGQIDGDYGNVGTGYSQSDSSNRGSDQDPSSSTSSIDHGIYLLTESDVESLEQEWLNNQRIDLVSTTYTAGSDRFGVNSISWAPGVYGEEHRQRLEATFGQTDRRLLTLYHFDGDVDGDYSSSANGAYDVRYRQFAQQLVDLGMENTIIAPSQEFNQDWSGKYPDNPENYGDGFARVVREMQSVEGADFEFVYAPSANAIGVADEAWPMDSQYWPEEEPAPYVAPSFYDSWGQYTDDYTSVDNIDQKREDSWEANHKPRLDMWREFAEERNAQMALREWGVATNEWTNPASGDNPYFVEKVMEYAKEHDFAFQTYWNEQSNNGGTHEIYPPNQLEQSGQAWREEVVKSDSGSEGSNNLETVDADNVVNLGSRGLQEGDRIGPYVDQYAADNTILEIPAGTYQWTDPSALQLPGMSNFGLKGVGGMVTLEQQPGSTMTAIFNADSGVVKIENIRFANQVDDSTHRIQADEGSTIILDDYERPDGGKGNSIGIYMPLDHAGKAVLNDVVLTDFSNNGLYAGEPGYECPGKTFEGTELVGENGDIRIYGGLYKNNNIAGLRIGSDGAVVRDARIVVDRRSTDTPTAYNMRGIWTKSDGSNLLIDSVDIDYTHTGEGSTIPIMLDSECGNTDLSGTIKDSSIETASSTRAIIRDDGDWTCENTEITGSGNTNSDLEGCSNQGTSESGSDPVDGDVYRHEGWEHGNLGIIEPNQDYDGVPDPYWGEAVVPTQDVARAGSWSHKIHIDSKWDFSDVNSYRVNPRPGESFKNDLESNDWSVWGVPFWHSFSFYVPEDWESDSQVEQLHEFHRDISENPGAEDNDFDEAACDYTGFCLGDGKPLSMRVDGSTLEFLTDYNCEDGSECQDIPTYSKNLQPGTWYDVVMHIKWSKRGDGDTGFMRIWVNDEKVYDHEGNTAAPDNHAPRAPKWGIYKWRWGLEEPDQETRTYYFDEFRYGLEGESYETMVPGER